ncbi:MAG: hypothetical protein LKJ86_07370 [Oscillibacter sp.]|jgi:hypothetical protein|nr:hypothetical protein [Oscillibacter sp.]
MELSENEKRRAVNLIWNTAGNYAFEPDFKVFDDQGRAELYWNSIIGAVYRHYDWAKLQAFFRTFRGLTDQMLFENLMWIGLEHAAYGKEAPNRPVLPFLRESYARRVVATSRGAENDRLVDVLEEAHFRRALGENPELKPHDRLVLDGLESGAELDTDALIARMTELFTKELGYVPAEEAAAAAEEQSKHWNVGFLRIGRKSKGVHVDLPAVRGFAFGVGEHADEYGGTQAQDQSHLSVRFARYTAQTDEGLRSYITNYFGAPLYDAREVQKLEKQFCVGNHRACHLHFTRGAYDDKMLANGYAGAQKRAALKQVEKNKAYYQANLAKNRHSIDRLTNRMRNSLLTQLESITVKSSAGRLSGNRVWRGIYLDDDKIFDRELRGDSGNLSVDILLDASTSQLHRQETLATQGYIIAESLTRCGLPVRVYSFCSMSGYTIVNLFRDYKETKKNENIFNFFATGCNRDGLAIRIAAGQLQKTDCEHKLLIVLSDAKPNDVLKVETSKNFYRDYCDTVGIDDTAAEVHQAKMNGISVICVFTGNDEDLPAARRIYGRDFTRIHSLEMFADTVGALIQTQIKNL